jgi:hypothetical protein
MADVEMDAPEAVNPEKKRSRLLKFSEVQKSTPAVECE